jgi:hypothetical protein
MFPSLPASPQKKPNVIQATLIFDLPIPPPEIPVEVIKEETPQAIEPEEQRPVTETAADNQNEPIPEPEVQIVPIPLQPQAMPAEREEKVSEEPEQIEKNDKIDEIMFTEQTIAPTASSELGSPTTSMAKRHLSNFQQQQRNRVAEQASRYYQQHKNSPVIDDRVRNPFITEDEKFSDTLKVRADCSSTSKKTTAVLLGFLGGQIDCSKPPPISGFISDRINKGSDLPGEYRHKDKTRPQSVVIKKEY